MNKIILLFLIFSFWNCNKSNSKNGFEEYKKLGQTDSLALLSYQDLDSLLAINEKKMILFGASFHPKSLHSARLLRENNVPFSLVGLDFASTPKELLESYKTNNPELLGILKKSLTKSEYKKLYALWDYQPNWAVKRNGDSLQWISLETVDPKAEWWK